MAQNKLIISQVMMPNQTNPSGNIYGGDIMKMMDSAAYAVTRKYARCNVVTARVDATNRSIAFRVKLQKI